MLAVFFPSTKRAFSKATASSTGALGPTRRTATVSLTALSSSSATRTTTPCCSTRGITAGSVAASSGSRSHLALTETSSRFIACLRMLSTANWARSAASPSRGPDVLGKRRTRPRPSCARTPCPWAADCRRHLAHASRSGCCSPCGSKMPPSESTRWSSGSSPAAMPWIASIAEVRCLGPPLTKILTGWLPPSSSSSTIWRWPWKCTILPLL
mmetsp:Transcript_59624/g.134306  ORF Transcript_59624/g.134306 Transcript_59624/m.134306 type:complete len:212 (-) Transcript_59624:182-817(-)